MESSFSRGQERAVNRPSRASALVEVAAMVVLVLSYIWGWQGLFRGDFLLIAALYFALGLLSHIRHGETARELGLRLDNWRRAASNASLIVALGVCAPLTVGAALGTWHFPPWTKALANLPWMLTWATAQQYGLLCFLYRRLAEVLRGPRPATLGAAMIFAAFHAPNPLLLGVTLAAGLACCTLYRREPNVFVLGVAHAAISFVLYSSLAYSVTHGLHVGPGYFAAR
jgi:hypothetical protein